MRWGAKGLLVAGVGLLGCEHHEDSAFICIVPIDCACDRELGFCGEQCPEGDYPADTSFEVQFGVGGTRDEISLQRCSVEQVGPFELRVHTSWYKREKNDLGTETWFECGDSTPPLAAGTWVIWSGEESGELVIPSEAVEVLCM